jgi:L-amino acid N-acyltransferase YncA
LLPGRAQEFENRNTRDVLKNNMRVKVSDSGAITIRNANVADMSAIQRIYQYYVLNGLASFEEIPPSTEEMASRRAAVVAAGLPYLVATVDDLIVGYSYATTYRPRPAYRHTVEDSVYVTNNLRARGVGAALLQAIIVRCEAGPWRQMLAVIGSSENIGSIALHRKMGFRDVGTLRSVGFKLGQWVDTVLMQRTLGPGASALPSSFDREPSK